MIMFLLCYIQYHGATTLYKLIIHVTLDPPCIPHFTPNTSAEIVQSIYAQKQVTGCKEMRRLGVIRIIARSSLVSLGNNEL